MTNCGDQPPPEQANQIHQERVAAKARTDAMVVEAEKQKLGMEKPLAGNDSAVISELLDNPGSTNLDCDDKLYSLAIHLDALTIARIERSEYIELSKLLPRDRVVPGDDYERLDLVHKDGRLALAPQMDKDASIISSYKKWEAAFDIYAGIFVRAHPRRGPEIYQYKHVIRNAADSFVWLGIYSYDRVFRTHMQSNPGRSWGKKLKDAWSDHVHQHKPAMHGDTSSGKKRKICRYFNKNGRCAKGAQCKYDHRCSNCLMFGHGKYNCRKLKKEIKEPQSSTTTANAKTSLESA